MDKLPDKVVHIESLRINRNIDKRCKCEDRTFVIDFNNNSVHCHDCGAWVDPFVAIRELALHYERLDNEQDALFEQRRQIMNYKPHLIVIRKLEEQYRGKQMIPCCPHCKEGFFLEELSSWTNRQMEILRREKKK